MIKLDMHPIRDFPALLRAHGLRATPQRIALAEVMFTAPAHFTPQKVFDIMKGRFPSISQNTIYLCLAHFEAAGLLQKCFVDGKTIFDSNTDRHDHAYCCRCGKLIDLPASSTETRPAPIANWSIDGESRVWYGLCPACMEA